MNSVRGTVLQKQVLTQKTLPETWSEWQVRFEQWVIERFQSLMPGTVESEQQMDTLEPVYKLVVADAPVLFPRDFEKAEPVTAWGRVVRPLFEQFLSEEFCRCREIKNGWRMALRREGLVVQGW